MAAPNAALRSHQLTEHTPLPVGRADGAGHMLRDGITLAAASLERACNELGASMLRCVRGDPAPAAELSAYTSPSTGRRKSLQLEGLGFCNLTAVSSEEGQPKRRASVLLGCGGGMCGSGFPASVMVETEGHSADDASEVEDETLGPLLEGGGRRPSMIIPFFGAVDVPPRLDLDDGDETDEDLMDDHSLELMRTHDSSELQLAAFAPKSKCD